MNPASAKSIITSILSRAGVTVDGNKPFDIRVTNDGFYRRVLRHGQLGLGESYLDGWWECDAIDQFVDHVLRIDLGSRFSWNWLSNFKARLFNMQKLDRAFEVGQKHYDLGNDLYKAMLDKRLNYTCGYWKNARTLDKAQEAKLDLVCRKIGLKPGMTVLELGCGFGAFAGYAAKKYGVKVTGVTVSKRQVELGMEMYKGLPVELRLDDYRNVTGTYDRVISIGIMEHVGYKNYRTYMEVVDRTLADNGIAFIHTIGDNVTQPSTNAWTTKYIFPNSVLPSIAGLAKAMEGLFVMEDWHNFGSDYDKTLMAWYHNFEKAWPKLSKNYSERFHRMWRFYLLSSAGGFRSRMTQLWQIVMTRPGSPQPACRLS
jgi:cyclopropane-fatty-acyl-phospholipid synthase